MRGSGQPLSWISLFSCLKSIQNRHLPFGFKVSKTCDQALAVCDSRTTLLSNIVWICRLISTSLLIDWRLWGPWFVGWTQLPTSMSMSSGLTLACCFGKLLRNTVLYSFSMVRILLCKSELPWMATCCHSSWTRLIRSVPYSGSSSGWFMVSPRSNPSSVYWMSSVTWKVSPFRTPGRSGSIWGSFLRGLVVVLTTASMLFVIAARNKGVSPDVSSSGADISVRAATMPSTVGSVLFPIVHISCNNVPSILSSSSSGSVTSGVVAWQHWLSGVESVSASICVRSSSANVNMLSWRYRSFSMYVSASIRGALFILNTLDPSRIWS